jgi:hypothetical protein
MINKDKDIDALIEVNDSESSYDIVRLQNQIISLHEELGELKGKIKTKINELEIDNNYCEECGIDYQNYARDILKDLLK